jgi:hypothetical protein
MRIRHLTIVVILFIPMICSGQQDNTWDKWDYLIGEWNGEGSGIPGEGTGTFTFSYDLDKKIIVRRSHSDYSAGDFKRRTIIDDLMIIYTSDNIPEKAAYFDSEGHSINYKITYPANSILFTSDSSSQAPVFRLTYYKIDNEQIKTRFEMSRDGINFTTYVEGISRKVNVTR